MGSSTAQGEEALVDGLEPTFRRKGVVVSTDILNNGPGGLVDLVPVMNTGYWLRSHVELETDGSRSGHTSDARCDQLRVLSMEPVSLRRGPVGPDQLTAIDQALRFVLAP